MHYMMQLQSYRMLPVSLATDLMKHPLNQTVTAFTLHLVFRKCWIISLIGSALHTVSISGKLLGNHRYVSVAARACSYMHVIYFLVRRHWVNCAFSALKQFPQLTTQGCCG